LIKTDHYSLKFLLDQRLSTIPQHQWASKLIGFNFRVEYKPSSANVVADALSRRDSEKGMSAKTLSVPSFQLFDDLRQKISSDPALVELSATVQDGAKGEQWKMVNGLITVHGKVYVSPTSPAAQLVLTSAHGIGHEGTEKTLHRVRADFFIPGARTAVQDFVRACSTCQRHKSKQLHPADLVQPLEVPTFVWAT
jgi:hypothetical protein